MSTAQPETGRLRAPAIGASAVGQPEQGRRLGLALFVIATAQLMVVLDATIVNVALPHIQEDLGFSSSALSWVINAYILTFGGSSSSAPGPATSSAAAVSSSSASPSSRSARWWADSP
jgi:hypothetical protein